MKCNRLQILAITLLVAALLVGLLVRVGQGHITDDMLALIDWSDVSEDATLARSMLLSGESAQMFFVFSGDGADTSADSFVSDLQSSGLFLSALRLDGYDWVAPVGAYYADHYLVLGAPLWFARALERYQLENESILPTDAVLLEWLSDDAIRQLDTFLQSDQAAFFNDWIPRDPLLFFPKAAEGFLEGASQSGRAHSSILVWGKLKNAPLSREGQDPVIALIDTLSAQFPESVGFHYTGVNRFSMANRVAIQKEVQWVNLIMFLLLGGVLWFSFGDVRSAFYLLLPLPVPMLLAALLTFLCFGNVHVISLVIGGIILGVALDYGFHVSAHRFDLSGAALRSLWGGCLTSMLAFLCLVFSPLRSIAQIGVFIGSGLLLALVSFLLYHRIGWFTHISDLRRIDLWKPAGKWFRCALGCFLVFALLGLMRIHFDDDVRLLQMPTKALYEEDALVRSAFSQSGRIALLTYGRDVDEVVYRASQLNAYPGAFNLLTFTGTPAQRDVFTAWNVEYGQQFSRAFRDQLMLSGYDVDAFAPFFDKWDQFPEEDVPALIEGLSRSLLGPLSNLAHFSDDGNWILTSVSSLPEGVPLPEGTIPLDQLGHLNQSFEHYRTELMSTAFKGLLLAALVTVLIGGLRKGFKAYLSAFICTAAGVGLCSWLGIPFNLFHVAAALLSVCLCLDYALFTVHLGKCCLPVSVQISGATTLTAFAVLAFSSIPAVHSIGLTVCLCVGISLVFCHCYLITNE